MNRRRAIETTCACRAVIHTGVDADTCGFSAAVDNFPLTRSGELLAVVAGRRVYELTAHGLHRRDRWAIRSTARGPVHAEHRCDEPTPQGWRQPTPPAKAAVSEAVAF